MYLLEKLKPYTSECMISMADNSAFLKISNKFYLWVLGSCGPLQFLHDKWITYLQKDLIQAIYAKQLKRATPFLSLVYVLLQNTAAASKSWKSGYSKGNISRIRFYVTVYFCLPKLHTWLHLFLPIALLSSQEFLRRKMPQSCSLAHNISSFSDKQYVNNSGQLIMFLG